MYQNKITFTPHDIYVKEFKIDTRGYRLKEVDQFLDIVIEDYEKFLNIINVALTIDLLQMILKYQIFIIQYIGDAMKISKSFETRIKKFSNEYGNC